MIDTCKCCNGYFSRQELNRHRNKYSFPKKLLVAVSIVVIVTMCIMPVETRSLEHKRRHNRRPESMAQTKDTITITTDHRRRHNRRLENLILPTKESTRQPKNLRADLFYRKNKIIMKKVKNTRNYLKSDRRALFSSEMREYKQAAPSWVPAVNFVEIHFHDYTRRNGVISLERKFTYQMPRLYKSLVEYKEIFKRLRDVELAFPDDPYNTYKTKRNRIIQNTINNLNSTIEEVKDSMAEVGLNVTLSQKNKLDLSTLEKKVDATQCLRNDYLAFRGYWNLINNWHFELRCPRRGELKTLCKAFEDKMRNRRISRKVKITHDK